MTKKAGSPATNIDVFSTAKIRELLELMKEYDLSEIDLMQADQQIRLARGSRTPMVVSNPVMATPAAPTAVDTPSGSSVSQAGITVGAAHIKTINSPMVGTFYTRPKPTADDFVKVGSKVSADTVVCIIEVMKVFNEIPAEIGGTIVEVLVKNDEPVDFNRPLFKVDTRS